MDKRREQLTELKSYIKGVENEIFEILQTLQWDRKHLLQSSALVTCKYDANHKIPPDKTEEHEKKCFLRNNGYSKEDQLLPDPLDLTSNSLVKLSKQDIEKIIANASSSDKSFKKGVGCHEAEPLSLERLQSSYSADERRAIHDAVVSAVPSCHDLTDLALLSGGYDKSSKVILSRQEILLELRNMRRRPTKYRVAAKSSNYSDVLRDVIRTQMEHYTDAKSETAPKEIVEKDTNQKDTHNERRYSGSAFKDDRYKYDGKVVPLPIKIKKEREDSTDRNYRDNNRRDYNRGRSGRTHRYEMGSRDRRDRDYDRRERKDRSRDRRNYHDQEKTKSHGENSRKRRHNDESRDRRNIYEDSENKEYSSEKRSSKSLRYKDYDSEYKANKDSVDSETSETSKDRRYCEKTDKAQRHKGKKDRRRDRDRSKEKRRDYRYEERSSQEIQIKQEREDSVTRDSAYENTNSSHKSKSRRRDRSNRDDREYYDPSVEVKQEKHERYYDMLSTDIYDPNKKIKKEQ